MSERRHPLAACEECPLNIPGNAFVPTKFPDSPPRLVAVGEAPGFQEATYREPFKGPSGRLLRTVLKHAGYSNDEVVFTNVCLCRPKDNATPPKAAVAACRGRLLAEITSSGAGDVLALGGTAADALIDDNRTITALRVGPPKQPTRGLDGSNVERVVATWHPAYCLRSADAFPALVSDVEKLKGGHVEPWVEPRWAVAETVADARQWIDELRRRADVLVIDIEVGIEKDTAFGHPNEYDMLCLGVGYAPGEVVVFAGSVFEDGEVRDQLRSLLAGKKLVAHNGKFDLAGLFPHLGGLELWFDTMLASYVLDERPGNHGLKVLAVEKLGAPKYDDEILKYIPRGGNYGDIPRPILYKYNAMDIGATWTLYEMFSKALDQDDLRRVHDLLVAASNQLMYLELNGIAVDLAYNTELVREFQKRLEDIEEDIDEIVRTKTAGEKTGLNPRSPKQVQEFFRLCGVHVESTNKDVLERFGQRYPESSTIGQFVRALLRHRKEQKLFGTYVQGIRKRVYRGRVYTTYLLHGTTSGRLASRNPNLQNIVRDKSIKRQFVVSKPGHIFVAADYKQAEGRIIATLAQDEYLRKVFSDPKIDIFNDLCDQMYGPGHWDKESRVRIKALFYGLSYGREAASIASEFGMTMREGEQMVEEFMGVIAATAAWQQEIKSTVLRGDDLVTPFGRRRRFHLITDQNQRDVLNEALSYLPQSTASDICLGALIRLRPLLKGMGWIRLTIHDAIVVECPESRRDQVSDLLKTVMLEEGRRFTDYVPFEVDLSYGDNWGDL